MAKTKKIIKNIKKTKKTKKISYIEQYKQNISIYWNHKMSRSDVGCSNLNINLNQLCLKAPVTGRTLEGYHRHLFPDLKNKSKSEFIKYFKNKNFLDMGSGINHIYNKSLLNHVLKKGYKAMGMDLYKFPKPQKHFKSGTVFKTKLKSNSFDIITSQYFLYYWLDDSKELIKAFKELNRILKKGGSIRIYPVYFGNYHYNDEKLITYLDNNFNIIVKKPKFYQERVAYIYPGDGLNDIKMNDIKMTDLGVPKKEKQDAENLEACSIIFTKK